MNQVCQFHTGSRTSLAKGTRSILMYYFEVTAILYIYIYFLEIENYIILQHYILIANLIY